MEDFTLRCPADEILFLEDISNLTLPEYLLQAAEKAVDNENAEWIINSSNGKSRKFSDFEIETRSVGSAMYKKGMRKGDTMIYLTHDMFYIHTICVGVWRANGIMRASYPEDDEQTLVERIEESRAGWLLCEEEAAQMCLSAASKIYWDVEVIVIGNFENCTSVDELFQDDGTELAEQKICSSDIALILCTSGTTGKCKGAVYSHENFLNTIIIVSKIPFFSEKFNLVISKGTHITGATFPFSTFIAKKTTLVIGKISVDSMFRAVDEFKPGLVFGFPTFLSLLVNHPDAKNHDFSSLEIALTGGAVISSNFEPTLMRLPNMKLVINNFGLTEVMPVTSEYDPSSGEVPQKYGETPPMSIGKVFVGMEVQVRDLENHKIVGPNERGEICIKSKGLFKGYFMNLEATKKAFTDDGWFMSGDVGYFDENGFIFIVDRIKEIFKYYNNHISPSEIEDIILKHGVVSEVSVIGVVDPDGGDRIPRAFVTLKPENQFNNSTSEIESIEDLAKEILDFANSQLVDYKRLRGGLYIVSELPRGKTGKISRQLVAQISIPQMLEKFESNEELVKIEVQVEVEQ